LSWLTTKATVLKPTNNSELLWKKTHKVGNEKGLRASLPRHLAKS
jgi:hypothetical protein